ncbi:hypothetical protein ASPWEDRAFT_75630, partial [Aspergillus wentii DTO 134E9]
MGSSASKPVRSAAAASRRQYPKKPSAPPTPTPATAPRAPKEPKPKPKPQDQAAPQAQFKPQIPATPQGPQYHSKEQASGVKSNAIDLDGRDPDFAQSLRNIGPVNPVPTYSHSSAFNQPSSGIHPSQVQTIFPQSSNPALLTVTARQRIAKAAEKEAEEYGRGSFGGREYADALTIRQALTMRDRQGLSKRDIESMLKLKKGFMDKFG